MADRAHLERLSKKLADDGKLIEAGWVGLRLACGLANAPADQLREMRLAFLGGAQHLFSSIMSLLDPGQKPTDADLRRMNLIADELQAASAELIASYKATKAAPTPEPAPPPTLGDAPIEEHYREQMNRLARVIDEYFNGEIKGYARHTAFVLLVTQFDDEGRCNYISNANRRDVVAMLKHQIARFEGQPDVSGTA